MYSLTNVFFFWNIQSMETSKNCVDNDENDGDVLKQESQDLAGLLSSPDTKPLPHDNNINPVKAELNSGDAGMKDEIKEEHAVKQEPVNPGSVGKLPNGDANSGNYVRTLNPSWSPTKAMSSARGIHNLCDKRLLIRLCSKSTHT